MEIIKHRKKAGGGPLYLLNPGEEYNLVSGG
jgi:hypothetical protein